MNNKIIFAMPSNEAFVNLLGSHYNISIGEFIIRNFPDEETYVRVVSDVKNNDAIIVCTLDHPDNKFLPIYFLSKTLKELGTKKITLIAPYLSYMRQDKRFSEGEAITSELFAKLVSQFIDELITVDPHLHRRKSLNEIYSINTKVLHAAPLISRWIKHNVSNAILIGPDSESEQWVSEVAQNADAPFVVLQKNRKGDRDVEISIPHLEKFRNHTPVLIDDIISTAKTMIETVYHLKSSGMKPPVCIGVHGIFANNAYYDLLNAGAEKIITCNTISHESNHIDIVPLLFTEVVKP